MWWFVGLIIIIGLGIAGVLFTRKEAKEDAPSAEEIAQSIEIIQ